MALLASCIVQALQTTGYLSSYQVPGLTEAAARKPQGGTFDILFILAFDLGYPREVVTYGDDNDLVGWTFLAVYMEEGAEYCEHVTSIRTYQRYLWNLCSMTIL
jgi:hypothetical protein